MVGQQVGATGTGTARVGMRQQWLRGAGVFLFLFVRSLVKFGKICVVLCAVTVLFIGESSRPLPPRCFQHEEANLCICSGLNLSGKPPWKWSTWLAVLILPKVHWVGITWCNRSNLHCQLWVCLHIQGLSSRLHGWHSGHLWCRQERLFRRSNEQRWSQLRPLLVDIS